MGIKIGFDRVLESKEAHSEAVKASLIEATKELHKTVKEVISLGLEDGRTWEQITRDAEQVAKIYKLASLTLLTIPSRN